MPCISKNAETMCYRSSSIPFILLALSLLAVSCGSRSGHTGQMPPMEIEIAVAEFDLLYTRRSFISQINSDNEVVVEPRVSGFLVARHYKKGMPVRKGQLIFEIDDSEYYTALLSAQAALESSRALALEAKNNFDRAVPLRSFYKTMSTLLGGSYINNFNRFGKLYQTYIQAAPEYRRDKYSLESYFVDDGQGNSIPVSSFTTVRDTTGVEFVSQFNLYRSIELTVNPAAKVSTGQAMDAIEAVAADVLPEAVGTTWSGLSYQEKTASGSSGAVYLLAIVFVFLTLSALYNSWGLPLAILLSVPLAVLGALLFVGAAYLVSPEFINNIYMQISLVMLIGLSAKNAILVVEYADQLFFEKNMDLKAATIEAARLRMRPIMMTAFSFILGVMPLIFASGVYATARNIMGMALVGGMLLATMLGIFIYPALYYLVARVGKFEHKRELKQKES